MNLGAFLAANWPRILNLTLGHVWLSLDAVAIALALGVPLGLLCYRIRPLARIVLNAVSVIYTIPTLALLGIMIPFLGIGTVPAVTAVVLYSLLPIVQNTYTGLATIAPEIRESAIGIGMSPGSRLWRVELPLALPILFAGLRVAIVNAIGMMTLASLIGAGGLGDLIFRGISTVSWPLVLAGSVPVLALAILADIGLKLLEQRLAEGRRAT